MLLLNFKNSDKKLNMPPSFKTGNFCVAVENLDFTMHAQKQEPSENV